MTYVANVSGDVNTELKQKEIIEFNNQFTKYAGRVKGYNDKANAISLQEFATICNLTREWNAKNPSDKVSIVIKEGIKKEVLQKYVREGSKQPLEELLSDLDIYRYYIEFKSQNIHYNSETGRIDQISLKMLQNTT